MIRKRRRKLKLRGNRTHGTGNTKNAKRGSSGGHGRAGSHKHKFSLYWKEYGKKGFKSKTPERVREVNLDELNREALKFEAGAETVFKAFFKKEGGLLVADFSSKPTKILGRGELKVKLTVKGAAASAGAKEAIATAGGKVE